MSGQFIVEADAPCVQGHFPGMPVVPGAWLLGKVHAGLLARYPDYRVETLTRVKFLVPLLSGQPAHINIDDSRWPRLQVSVLRLEQLNPSGAQFEQSATQATQILNATFVMAPVSRSLPIL